MNELGAMDGLVTVEQYARWRYQGRYDGKPKKSQLETVRQMCQEGRFANAFKIGRLWVIDLDAERSRNAAEKSGAALP